MFFRLLFVLAVAFIGTAYSQLPPCNPCNVDVSFSGSACTCCDPTGNVCLEIPVCSPCDAGVSFAGSSCPCCDPTGTNCLCVPKCRGEPNCACCATVASSFVCIECEPGFVTCESSSSGTPEQFCCPAQTCSVANCDPDTCVGSTCTGCIAGYQPCNSDTECCPCAPGTFSGLAPSVSCAPCPPGTFSNTEGSTACTACPLNKFQPQRGQTCCFGCQPDCHTQSVGSADCVPNHGPVAGHRCDPHGEPRECS